ncbi:GAF domain-containing protein [Flexivirga sp. ID2601S]|uniref:GAF domain-containing protein n=1 Tax=Flexivirga aerilata TaxID=1656889 RepID=A0A849AVV5_9MICO|nr:GAF domain-containing protein [Flexivirga aerilata]NNG40802.1 GAF domain-containing protein [Flexivirga aerilata]
MPTDRPTHGFAPRDVAEEARAAFLEHGDPAAVRPVVFESWVRSMTDGLDPEAELEQVPLAGDDLSALRERHPLAELMPLIRSLLTESAAEAGLLVAVSDAAGRLLWVEGDEALRARAEGMLFLPGADWAERVVGTNAPGTALATGRPVRIRGAEHLARQVTPWSCSAAPIHDPDTGAMLGALDLTGGDVAAGPQSLALVSATVAAVEAQLRLQRLSSGLAVPQDLQRPAPHRLDVLGAGHATLASGDSVRRFGLRHSELLLLLAETPGGLTADQLAIGLSDDDRPSVTLRAEISRLRGLLPPGLLASRPYRFAGQLRTDVQEVRDCLDRGDVAAAVSRYRGAVLPDSEAPGVIQLRDQLHARMRNSVLAHGDSDLLLRFADTAFGRDDLQLWEAAELLMAPGSPRQESVSERVRGLRGV